MSLDFQSYLQQKGITSKCRCPHTQQQNGQHSMSISTSSKLLLIKKKNLQAICTLLIDSVVSTSFWVEAVSTIV